MKKYTLGFDFGTESERTVLVEINSGEIVAVASHDYSDGVVDKNLPGSTEQLPPEWALQNPQDWMDCLEKTVPQVIRESRVEPAGIIGIGIDFTACTILPTLEDGTPLCFLDKYKNRPNAWTKLWKHHAAQPYADRVNKLAEQRNEAFLPRYGGIISSEWSLPKAWQVLDEDADIYQVAHYFVEGADWVAWQLGGKLFRNSCGAGYKGMWHKSDGFPSQEFLATCSPDLTELFTKKFAGPMAAPGEKVGELNEKWAQKLGLTAGISIGGAIIDAHSAAIGGGVTGPGTLFMIMGTSTCHMLMAEEEVLVAGISGVVEDGIVPGFFGYEAGQAGVGDIFAWLVKNGVPPVYHDEAKKKRVSLHEILTEKAQNLQPGQSGLLALDWWNGCRTPLVDADLTGVMVGYSLQTTAEEIYRALIEATAFGTRKIVELFREGGVRIDHVCAGGGLTQNKLLMQIYADIIGVPIEVAASPQSSALGAAIIGAVAGKAYPSISVAASKMAPPPERIIEPIPAHHKIYSSLYKEYELLSVFFGENKDSVLKKVKALR
ncbi:MAG: ribulokinase [Calditrichaeota bacterium]|nr:MAG: ribulokinase [Calditrichota bacterium]